MSKRIDGRKHAQWRERITRFTQTSLTISEFCRSEGVPDGSFYYWRRKLAELPANQNDSSLSATGRFLPVQVTPAVDATEIEFTFPNGASMRLPSADRKLLRWAIESVATASFERGEG